MLWFTECLRCEQECSHFSPDRDYYVSDVELFKCFNREWNTVVSSFYKYGVSCSSPLSTMILMNFTKGVWGFTWEYGMSGPFCLVLPFAIRLIHLQSRRSKVTPTQKKRRHRISQQLGTNAKGRQRRNGYRGRRDRVIYSYYETWQLHFEIPEVVIRFSTDLPLSFFLVLVHFTPAFLNYRSGPS